MRLAPYPVPKNKAGPTHCLGTRLTPYMYPAPGNEAGPILGTREWGWLHTRCPRTRLAPPSAREWGWPHTQCLGTRLTSYLQMFPDIDSQSKSSCWVNLAWSGAQQCQYKLEHVHIGTITHRLQNDDIIYNRRDTQKQNLKDWQTLKKYWVGGGRILSNWGFLRGYKLPGFVIKFLYKKITIFPTMLQIFIKNIKQLS